MQLSTTLVIATVMRLASAIDQACATTPRPAGEALANVEADGGEFTVTTGPYIFAPDVDDIGVHYRAAPYSNYIDWVFQPVPPALGLRNMTVISREERPVIACFKPAADLDYCVWLDKQDTCSLEVDVGIVRPGLMSGDFKPVKDQFSYYAGLLST